MGTNEPETIEDQPYEIPIERACAIDVAKDSGKVCLRIPAGIGGTRRKSVVWDVPATTRAVTELADRLRDEHVGRVTVESTSDYWRIWFYVLEAEGLSVQLVNARDVKNVPGRPKTDKLDAVWLAKLTERGMLRPSFVPPASVRHLRDYTRMRIDLTRERTRNWQRMEKLLEDALIKVTVVASRVNTVSVRAMIEALIDGERDPNKLAGLAQKRMQLKHDALVQALTGRFDDHHAELAQILLDQIDALTAQIDRLSSRITQLCDGLDDTRPVTPDDNDSDDSDAGGGSGSGGQRLAPIMSTIDRLAEITGIGRTTAEIILAEIGPDMSVFATAGHLASWAKLTPRAIQSGNRSTAGRTGKGNPYLKGALGSAAAAAARTNTFLGERYRRLVKHRGKMKALVAVAHSILTIIYELISDPSARYHDLGPDYHSRHLNVTRRTRQLTHQLETLGYTVTLATAAA